MKGTLFSSDYVIDANSELRLVEINTDTGFIQNTFDSRYDFTDLYTLWSANNITNLTIIYKEFQTNLVEYIQTDVASNATFITSVTLQKERNFDIYPEVVEDSAEKFILRLAYDESAIFDSNYCKSKTKLLNLFHEYTASAMVPEYYASSSAYLSDGLLSSSVNDGGHMPDVCIKATWTEAPVQFGFLGTQEGATDTERYTNLIGELDLSVYHVEKFHYNEAQVDNEKVQSIRSYDVLYSDSGLKVINIARYKVEGNFTIPQSDTQRFTEDYLESNIINKLNVKHSFEFGTKYLQAKKPGIFVSHSMIDSSNNPIQLSELNVSQSVKGFYIPGLPDGDSTDDFIYWSASGDTLPDGSIVSESIVQSTDTFQSPYNVFAEVTLVNDDQLLITDEFNILVYNTSSNEIRYEEAGDLTQDHYIISSDSSLIQVSASHLAVASHDVWMNDTDIEEIDSYIVSSSVGNYTPIVHNCFVAGTPIRINNDEVKNIEDVIKGDTVLSFNLEKNIHEEAIVGDVKESQSDEGVIVYFKDGSTLTTTFEHPFYVEGWEWTIAGKLIEGDVCWKHNGTNEFDKHLVNSIELIEKELTVYNLLSVGDNHNFLADDVLVHNKMGCFASGVQISLSNGDTKNIEDIVIGDEVLGWNGEELEKALVTDVHTHKVGDNKDICEGSEYEAAIYSLNTLDIEFSPVHPFLTKEGWKSLVPSESIVEGITELKIGDEINKDGEWIKVESIHNLRNSEDEIIYNIRVDKLHSYIANGIIVHNK
jgi:intein/homing endonuclease